MKSNKAKKISRSKVILEVRDLSKKYRDGKEPRDVLTKVKFSVFAKDFIGIIGPSGSGKSTLLNCLTGIEDPDSGLIYFNEKNFSELTLNEKSAIRSKEMGFVFQENNLVEFLTVRENLGLKLQLLGKGSLDVKKRIDEIIDEFEIKDLISKNLSDLTYYESQLIALAIAFTNNPSIVFMDEPSAKMSSEQKKMFFDKVTHIHSVKDVAIIIFSHDAGTAMSVSKVIRLENGKII